MNILGIKIGGAGKVDKDRPYSGYKLCYGSKSLSACRSEGCIPLSVQITEIFAYASSNTTKNTPSVTITFGSSSSTIIGTFMWSDSSDYSQWKGANNKGGISSGYNIYYDLEVWAGGDLNKLKSITSINVSGRTNNAPLTVGNIRRWLEPISSGGGGSK